MKEIARIYTLKKKKNQNIVCICHRINNVIDLWLGQEDELQEHSSTSRQPRRYAKRRLDLVAQEEEQQDEGGPQEDQQHRNTLTEEDETTGGEP